VNSSSEPPEWRCVLLVFNDITAFLVRNDRAVVLGYFSEPMAREIAARLNAGRPIPHTITPTKTTVDTAGIYH
jgi:hypothetical protein